MEIGATVTVQFNGSHYQGEVLSITKSGLRLVRFTTGSGTVRERKFSVENLAHYATNPSARERGRVVAERKCTVVGIPRETWGECPTRARVCYDPACPLHSPQEAR